MVASSDTLALASHPGARYAPEPWPLRLLHAVGRRTQQGAGYLGGTLHFPDEVVLSLRRLLRGRSPMRRVGLVWQLGHTGPRSVPITALLCGLVGLILTSMSAVQLLRFGARSFITDVGGDGARDRGVDDRRHPGRSGGRGLFRAAGHHAVQRRDRYLARDGYRSDGSPRAAAPAGPAVDRAAVAVVKVIVRLRDTQGTTVVLVTHELDSLFKVADRALFLDAQQRTMTALGQPQLLLQQGPPAVRASLRAQGPR